MIHFEKFNISDKLQTEKEKIKVECQHELQLSALANRTKAKNLAKIVLWWDQLCEHQKILATNDEKELDTVYFDLTLRAESLIDLFYAKNIHPKTRKNNSIVLIQLYKALKNNPDLYNDETGDRLAGYCTNNFTALIEIYHREITNSTSSIDSKSVSQSSENSQPSNDHIEQNAAENTTLNNISLSSSDTIYKQLDSHPIKNIETYLDSRKSKARFIPEKSSQLNNYSLEDRVAVLKNSALDYFKYCKHIPQLSTTDFIKSSNEGFAIGIFKTGTADGKHQILGTTLNKNIITQCLVEAYRDKFDALSKNIIAIAFD